jgi:lipopolysaccharide export system protein LptA
MTNASLTGAFRAVLIITFVAVIGVTAWYFVGHRRPGIVPPAEVDAITPQKVERQEGIQHFDFHGERVIQAEAARYYAGENSLYYLEGNVRITDRKKGREDVVISGDRASHNKDWTEALIERNASLSYGDLTVESPSFTYRKGPLETISTDKGAAVTSPRLSGRADSLVYSFKDKSIRLEGNVALEIREEAADSFPLELKGDVFTYSRRNHKGSASENVSFSQGESRGQAESLDFRLTADERYLRNLILKGNARAYLVEDEEAESPGKSLLLARGRHREISADEIRLRAFPNLPRIQALRASGNCLLRSLAASGQLAEVTSDSMSFLFGRAGVLREFRASTGAKMVEKGTAGVVERTISGDEIIIGTEGSSLRVRMEKEGEARVDTRDSEITARRISLEPQRETLVARGAVKAILKLRPREGQGVGFFSTDAPVFITCQSLRYEPDQERLFLREGIRMWQEKQMLFAENLTVSKDTGDISGEGRVRAIFPFPPKKEEDKEERIEMGGEKMNLSPQDNLLTFEESCWLLARNVDLKSGTLLAYLKEEGGEIQRIEARRDVVIREESRQGRGAKALYEPGEDTIVLTGNPTLVDKEKGVIEGDKLTFHLGDGRILVENKNRERSVTVIKS